MLTARRIGLVAALLGFILLVVAVGVYWWADAVLRDVQARQALPGWMDSLRAQGRIPDLTGLALPRTDDADGSTLVHEPAAAWRPAHNVTVLFGAVSRGRPVLRGDSALWRSLDADTGLDRVVRLARARRWDATARTLAGDSAVVWTLRLPRFGLARQAMMGLVLRATWRASHGDPGGARADLGAVLGLGAQLARREPTSIGAGVGRTFIREGARACAAVFVAPADSLPRARCRAVLDWSAARHAYVLGALEAFPDSAVAVAADTSLPLGWRAQALTAVGLHSLHRLRGIVFGVPRSDLARLAPFLEDADPDVARLARLVRRSAEVLNRGSMRERFAAAGAAF